MIYRIKLHKHPHGYTTCANATSTLFPCGRCGRMGYLSLLNRLCVTVAQTPEAVPLFDLTTCNEWAQHYEATENANDLEEAA